MLIHSTVLDLEGDKIFGSLHPEFQSHQSENNSIHELSSPGLVLWNIQLGCLHNSKILTAINADSSPLRFTSPADMVSSSSSLVSISQ